MKRAFVLAAALVTAAALNGTADAAQMNGRTGQAGTASGSVASSRFDGVIVAKDAKRKAVVTVSRGSVRTVRAPSKFRRLRVGQRVAVTARALPDGTYAAAAVRGQGRVSRVRFRGIVVRHDRRARRLILSAGGSVFAARMSARGTATANPEEDLSPGDKVEVGAEVDDGRLEAGDVDETGHVEMLVLEGIFLSPTRGGFDLAVVHRGLVHVNVPDGMLLPAFKAGDQIIIVVRVGEDGFVFMKGMQDSREHEPSKPGEAVGTIAGKGPFSITVRREDGSTMTCAVPAGLDMAVFKLGEKAKLRCVLRDGKLVMIKLQTEHASLAGDGSGEISMYGVLTSMSATSISARRADGTLVTCTLANPVDFSYFRLGEKAKLRCHLEARTWRFAGLYGENASIDEFGHVEVYVHGAFQGRSGSAVVVRRPDGSDFGCNAPESLNLSYFTVGEQVKLHCRLDSGSRTLLALRSERYTVGADGSVELYAYGSLTAKNETSLTVTAADAQTFTCSFPAGLDLSRFPVGTQVKVNCHLLGGAFRLEYMKSETAVVEVKL